MSELTFNCYSGFKVVLPDSRTASQTAAFARQFVLWAEAVMERENALRKLNSRLKPGSTGEGE